MKECLSVLVSEIGNICHLSVDAKLLQYLGFSNIGKSVFGKPVQILLRLCHHCLCRVMLILRKPFDDLRLYEGKYISLLVVRYLMSGHHLVYR